MKKASVPDRAAAVIARACASVAGGTDFAADAGAVDADAVGACPAVAMVSGGSDSVALAYALADLRDAGRLPCRVAFVHINHNLRGEASDGDAAFVRALARHLGFELREFSIDVPALMGDGGNMEAVARAARYRAAAQALSELGAEASTETPDAAPCGLVLTAHTADDRVENFFMRAIVGTGPGGFRSMGYVSQVEGCAVCRPLLDMGREELREFIRSHADALLDPAAPADCAAPGGFCAPGGRALSFAPDGCAAVQPALWREDATNADTDRFRAYVRREIVPQAKARNPRLLDTLTRTMNLIAQEDDMVAAMADELAARMVRRLDAAGCKAAPSTGCNAPAVAAAGFAAGALHGSAGVLIAPELAESPVPLQRRVLDSVLTALLPADDRVETASIEACLSCLGASGRVVNIQGDLAVSYNKRGLRIEPMAAFRARRNRG